MLPLLLRGQRRRSALGISQGALPSWWGVRRRRRRQAAATPLDGMDQTAEKEEEEAVVRRMTVNKRLERTRGRGVNMTTSWQTRKRRRRQWQGRQQWTRGRRE